MPGCYEFTFLPDGTTTTFYASAGNYYQLEDGTRIDLHTRPVWCRRCNKISDGEQIESIEEIDKRIAYLKRLAARFWQEIDRPPLPEPDAPGDREQLKEIAELQLRRRWRLQRKSPPKCIVCGSTDILDLPTATIEMTMVGFYDNKFSNEWFFIVEGERIPK